MKNLLSLLLLSASLSAQQPIPEPVDHGQEKTHKAKHENTPFYTKSEDGKSLILCGYLFESRDGGWYSYLSGRISQRFDTRAEAAAWMKFSCPIPGSVVTK